MRKLIFIIMLCAFLAGPVLADPYVELYYQAAPGDYSTYPFRDGSGGEFTVKPMSGWTYDVLSLYHNDTKNQVLPGADTDPTFQTFCVESETSLGDEGHLYRVELNDYAVTGDGGSVNGQDPLSVGAAYLYYQFATATGEVAALYDYDESMGGRDNEAYKLQKALWALEEETGFSYPTSGVNLYYDAAIAKFTNLAGAQADNAGHANQYPVKVMNLWGSDTDSQDQLVLVPVPTAVLLGILGLGVAGIKLRKYA